METYYNNIEEKLKLFRDNTFQRFTPNIIYTIA